MLFTMCVKLMHATETTPVNETSPELKAFWVFIANICALESALHQLTILDRMIHAHAQHNDQLYMYPEFFIFLKKEPTPTRTLAISSNIELEHGVPFKVLSTGNSVFKVLYQQM
jgi:hypothetical protein